jgi:hypothetical protein
MGLRGQSSFSPGAHAPPPSRNDAITRRRLPRCHHRRHAKLPPRTSFVPAARPPRRKHAGRALAPSAVARRRDARLGPRRAYAAAHVKRTAVLVEAAALPRAHEAHSSAIGAAAGRIGHAGRLRSAIVGALARSERRGPARAAVRHPDAMEPGEALVQIRLAVASADRVQDLRALLRGRGARAGGLTAGRRVAERRFRVAIPPAIRLGRAWPARERARARGEEAHPVRSREAGARIAEVIAAADLTPSSLRDAIVARRHRDARSGRVAAGSDLAELVSVAVGVRGTNGPPRVGALRVAGRGRRVDRRGEGIGRSGGGVHHGAPVVHGAPGVVGKRRAEITGRAAEGWLGNDRVAANERGEEECDNHRRGGAFVRA